MSVPSAPASIRASIRGYLLVGLVLFGGTAATVAVATVPWLDVGQHGLDNADVIVGLMIATSKALLVAAIFMHLNHECRLIYLIIGLAGVHCLGMFALTMLAEADGIRDPYFFHAAKQEDPESRIGR